MYGSALRVVCTQADMPIALSTWTRVSTTSQLSSPQLFPFPRMARVIMLCNFTLSLSAAGTAMCKEGRSLSSLAIRSDPSQNL
eukprot:3994169-Amphidinium_carterae.1